MASEWEIRKIHFMTEQNKHNSVFMFISSQRHFYKLYKASSYSSIGYFRHWGSSFLPASIPLLLLSGSLLSNPIVLFLILFLLEFVGRLILLTCPNYCNDLTPTRSLISVLFPPLSFTSALVLPSFQGLSETLQDLFRLL